MSLLRTQLFQQSTARNSFQGRLRPDVTTKWRHEAKIHLIFAENKFFCWLHFSAASSVGAHAKRMRSATHSAASEDA